MKIIDVEQGSMEWRKLRAGVATSSATAKLVTPKRLQPSAQLFGYACQLASEVITGLPHDAGDSASIWTERGLEVEADALSQYALEADCDPTPAGFCLSEDGFTGCSPDGLVLPDGGVEIKCPSAAVHVGYFSHEGVPADYMPQIQWHLFVTGFSWWDFYSYCPKFPSVLRRVRPDERWQEALAGAVGRLRGAVSDILQNLLSAGAVKAKDRPAVTSFAQAAGIEPGSVEFEDLLG